MKTIRIPVSDEAQKMAKKLSKLTKFKLSAIYEKAFLKGLDELENENK
jgi:hypothetical protein